MTFTEGGKEYEIAPTNGSRYYLIEFYPSEMRDEKINVGVIGVGKGGTRSYVVSDAAWERIGTWTKWEPSSLQMIRGHIAEMIRIVMADVTEIEQFRYGDYARVIIHRQGSSILGTEELETFVGIFCYMAEGRKYRWGAGRRAADGSGAEMILADGNVVLRLHWGVQIGARVIVTGGRSDDCGTAGTVRGVAFTDRWYVLVTREGDADREEPLYAEDVVCPDRVEDLA